MNPLYLIMRGLEKQGLVGVLAKWGAKLLYLQRLLKTKTKAKVNVAFSSVWIDGMIKVQEQLFHSTMKS